MVRPIALLPPRGLWVRLNSGAGEQGQGPGPGVCGATLHHAASSSLLRSSPLGLALHRLGHPLFTRQDSTVLPVQPRLSISHQREGSSEGAHQIGGSHVPREAISEPRSPGLWKQPDGHAFQKHPLGDLVNHASALQDALGLRELTGQQSDRPSREAPRKWSKLGRAGAGCLLGPAANALPTCPTPPPTPDREHSPCLPGRVSAQHEQIQGLPLP